MEKKSKMETNRIISKSQQELYSLYGRLSIQYLEIYKNHIKGLAVKKEINIVDLGGCGGHFANAVKSFFNDNGVEANVTVVDYCRYSEWEEFGEINFVHEDAFTALAQMENGKADIIFINALLHHLVFDTYKKTRDAQKRLLELAYEKLNKDGYLCIRENYAENPVLRGLSVPLVYYITKSQNPAMIKISSNYGANSAGVGVCFFTPGLLLNTIKRIGFVLVDKTTTPWEWERKHLVRSNKTLLVLKK